MSSLFAGPIAVAYHIVTWLSQILTPLTGGVATAAAIVAFTIAVRLLLSPLSFLGLRGQARVAAMQPRIAQLRAQYARQPDKLQAELGSLYAAEAGGMMAGCLPLLLQLPFFSVMYRLFLSGTVSDKPNELRTGRCSAVRLAATGSPRQARPAGRAWCSSGFSRCSP